SQVNLLFLGCAFILLYVSVTPVDAEACGYHYHTNNYFTRYYTGYFKRFHPLFYGFCTSGVSVICYPFLCYLNNKSFMFHIKSTI
uniref:Uncharacterized protein n=1 Tax=Magallana gigas TaxID=29159 RepID=A0A8W8JFH8_MAGGI